MRTGAESLLSAKHFVYYKDEARTNPVLRQATKQRLLDFRVRNRNAREISEGIGIGYSGVFRLAAVKSTRVSRLASGCAMLL